MIKFGVAGNSVSFFNEGNETTKDAAQWCRARGIDVFEYSFGRGITLSEATAKTIGAEFATNCVELTAHSPYFINFSNLEPEMIDKSIGYVLTTLKKVLQFGGNRIVVHPASVGKATREKAFSVCIQNLQLLREKINSEYSDNNFVISFETMGKLGQIGTVSEIIEICKIDKSFYPCCDFGHINAREQGALKRKKDYTDIFDRLLDSLPLEKVINMHIHFSKIMYGTKGEIKHLTFSDDQYGPDYQPFIEAVLDYKLEPCIISESNGTQAEDTLTMKSYYYNLKK